MGVDSSNENGEITETDLKYQRGMISGAIATMERKGIPRLEFDPKIWQRLYGCRIVHESIPHYPSEEAGRRDEGGIDLVDWGGSIDEKYLKEGAELPRDRHGKIVFENGIVVSTSPTKPPYICHFINRYWANRASPRQTS